MKKTIKQQVLAKMLATQQIAPIATEQILKEFKQGLEHEKIDPITDIIINAIENAEDVDDIYNDIEHAISQLRRAEQTLQ